MLGSQRQANVWHGPFIIEAKQMKHCNLFAIAFLGGLLLLAPKTQAESLTFSGSDSGGTGSATMNISISGNVVTTTLDNTSPITLDDSDDGNAPAITGFGFNLENLTLDNMLSWSLEAYNATDNQLVTIGSNTDSTLPWSVDDEKLNGVKLDLLADNGEGVHYGLYNPESNAVDRASGSDQDYFTTATLVVEFDSAPVLAPLEISENSYVRMMNVGLNGDGSLKLNGTLDDDPTPTPSVVPEPASGILFGLGMIVGLAFFGARRKKCSFSR